MLAKFSGNQASNGATDSGAAYVFALGQHMDSTGVSQSFQHGAGDFFVATAISGDTVVVGASLEDSAATGVNGNQADNSATNSGAAYVFNGLPATAPLQNISTRAEVLTGGMVPFVALHWHGPGCRAFQ